MSYKSQTLEQNFWCYYTVVDRILCPTKIPCPNPQNLMTCHFTRQRDFTDVIKALDLEMGMKIILDDLSWSNAIQQFLVKEKQEDKSPRNKIDERKRVKSQRLENVIHWL